MQRQRQHQSKSGIAALAILMGSLLLSGGPAVARDEQLKLPIKAALESPEAAKRLDLTVRLYFGEAPHPAPEAELGELKVEKKVRALGRSNEVACHAAFLNALLVLQKQALAAGANAVIGIASFFHDQPLISDSEYLCDAGNLLTRASLGGKFVRLPVKK